MSTSTAAHSDKESSVGSQLTTTSDKSLNVVNKDKKLSRAMKAYLERAHQFGKYLLIHQ